MALYIKIRMILEEPHKLNLQMTLCLQITATFLLVGVAVGHIIVSSIHGTKTHFETHNTKYRVELLSTGNPLIDF